MKRFAIILCALTLFAGTVNAATELNTNAQKTVPYKAKMEEQRKAHEKEFEQKLGLTDEQKTKAKELRQQGFEKIKPVMDELRSKKQEAAKIKNSDLTNDEKEQKLSILDKEIQELHKKASDIRKQNMKDFESILDKNQRTILKDMKKEGRENFQKGHRPPMKGHRPTMQPKANFYSNN